VFLFSELIRLFKRSEAEDFSDEDLASLFSKGEIEDLQYLWPSLSWKENEISFDDKLFLITKLIGIEEASLNQEDFLSIFEKLAGEVRKNGNDSQDNVLRVGTKIYLGYLRKLYEHFGENWEQVLETATKEVLAKKDLVEDPGPWGNTGREKAIRKLVRNSDFRREKEKGLEQILQGQPEIPGITEGVVGVNIVVGFTIEEVTGSADAFITDIGAFGKKDVKGELENRGVVVVSRTRIGTHRLKKGDKVWVDGTSGIIFRSNP
jgi:hypothetical protein